jgi:hypothetical protein
MLVLKPVLGARTKNKGMERIRSSISPRGSIEKIWDVPFRDTNPDPPDDDGVMMHAVSSCFVEIMMMM